jgi:FdhE protein
MIAATQQHLEGVRRFEQSIGAALGSTTVPAIALTDREGFVRDLANGTPLLHSDSCPELDGVSEAVAAILAQVEVPGSEDAVSRVVTWHVLRQVLAPAILDLRQEVAHVWTRGACPTCGSDASLALLVETEDGRERMLACACCRTLWKFKRVGCPHCGNDAQDRLTSLQIEGEDDVRVDLCDACFGYTKTFTGASERAGSFLDDWPTLHLDVIARERGYTRGPALYEI